MPAGFELSVETTFTASHAIVMRGERETPHAHDWRVTLTVRGDALDADGLLCDFHEIERALRAVVGPWHGGDLNRSPPFDRLNPTAELVARHIACSVQTRLPTGIQVGSVRVTEAPGCAATYYGE